MINKKFLLAGRPVGRPISDDDFEYIEEEIREINDGELLLENMVIEFQPAQKGWMENISNYVAPLEIGDVMRCSGIARVIDSKSGKFKKGDHIKILDKSKNECARGLSSFSSHEIKKILGHHSKEIEKILGYISKSEVVHKDDLVEI